MQIHKSTFLNICLHLLLNCIPHDAVGRAQLFFIPANNQVITLLVLITVMLITAINEGKKSRVDKGNQCLFNFHMNYRSFWECAITVDDKHTHCNGQITVMWLK